MKPDLKVAIVHDWLVGGGAERVVYELHRMFPDAPIYTSYCTPEWRQKLDGKVITGFLQWGPFGRLRKFLPILRIWWFGRLRLGGYDLILSSSGAEAKGIKTKKPSLHVNYCHAPTHYYWSRYDEYLHNPGFPTGFNWLAKLGLRLLVWPLRKWDYKAAQRPDYMIANSLHTQAAIKKYYGRRSTVIHPPIDTDRFANVPPQKRAGFVIAGRQTPYKRIDLAVTACTQLGVPLTVIGNGPDHERLVRLAGPTINFVVNPPDEEVVKHFAAAEAFIFPGTDDFGITPVEAMATGTPVIAYKAGGALDYVTPTTGLFFEAQTTDSLIKALQQFKTNNYIQGDIKSAAQAYSTAVFHKKLRVELERVLQ
ncbi:MAG TPA: glycosyltransferase [Candidatus Limnocylindrales bacterium]|nr:glycosyltransferase [Candidatus Limnocylindrales bacterium]